MTTPVRRHEVGSLRHALSRLLKSKLTRAGLLAFAGLGVLAVFADLFASDYPLYCTVAGKTYVLPAVTHPRALSGTDNARIARETTAFAIYPLVRRGPTTPTDEVMQPPSGAHPFGTDASGRDVLAQTIHGVRTQLGFALLAVLSYVMLGTLVGAIAGFLGGGLDFLAERLIDTMSAMPSFVLVLCVQAALPHPDLTTLFVAVVLARFAEVARLVRVEVQDVASRDYVLAARALGASPLRVLWRHVMPNARVQAIVSATFGLGTVVFLEAQLEFLRVGDSGRWASWGQVMADVRTHPQAYWLLLFPGVFLLLTVIASNLVGEALRDALDPREVRARSAPDADARTYETTPPTSRRAQE